MPDTSTPPTANSPAPALAFEEAARYALLRRLTPAIRHHLVGQFQPLGMVAAMLERRLQLDPPNVASLRENASMLGDLSRTAAASCTDLLTWIAPPKTSITRLDAGLLDCLNLLSTEFRFRGLVIVNEVQDMPALVSTTALRSVFPAALIALSDKQTGAADLLLQARKIGRDTALSILRLPAKRPADNQPTADYRALNWHDVAALAQAESVGFSYTPDGASLRFAHAGPQLAP
jgi:hypothetical protein